MNTVRTENRILLLLLAGIVLLFLVASTVLPRADAASNTGGTVRHSYSITAVPTAVTCSSPVAHTQHGEVEVAVDTEDVTSNSYTLSLQQSASQSGPYMVVTPTALNGSSTSIVTTTNLTALEADTDLVYTRACFAETTGTTTETLGVDFLLKNTVE